ncbi:MAG: adenylate cyclase [archaeon GW2011_AR21]|nr:MAG: adenylate cyclase [archaeon GW2011_AR21]
MLAIIFIFAIAVALLLARLKIWIAGIASVALAIGFLAFAVLRFENGVIMNIVFPALSIFATFGIVSAGFYVMEEKQKQWVKSIFGKYVSESVAKEILEKTSADEVRLGGSRKYVTILFADIRGFTSMSEKLQPEEVVELLNTYLSSMTKCVFENKGTLDKYIGDAIMAVFNAPLEQENHQLLAVKAALEMQKAVAELNAKLGKSLQYGIGVNSGFAVVGNIGSEKRLEYTAIGDSVNTASRLCGIAEGGQVLASLETFNAVKDKALAKKIGSLKVKNRKKPVMVFQILELKPEGLKD